MRGSQLTYQTDEHEGTTMSTDTERASKRPTRTMNVAEVLRNGLLEVAIEHRKRTQENKPYRAFTDAYIRQGLARTREALALNQVFPPAEPLIAFYDETMRIPSTATIVADASLASELDEMVLSLRRRLDTVITRRALVEFYMLAGLIADGVTITDYPVPDVLRDSSAHQNS
jgi:ribosomal protein S4